MFCPSCGTQTETGIKYCKKCGLALNRVRGVMNRGSATTDYNDVWMQEKLDTIERKRKKSPEEKRYEELKGGVITTAIGVSVMVFLYFLMTAIAHNEPHDAEIVSKIWMAGLVPTFIGLALLFNGLFISPKIVALKRREALADQESATSWGSAIDTNALDAPPLNVLPAANFDYSVTEHTTARLKDKIPIPASRDTN